MHCSGLVWFCWSCCVLAVWTLLLGPSQTARQSTEIIIVLQTLSICSICVNNWGSCCQASWSNLLQELHKASVVLALDFLFKMTLTAAFASVVDPCPWQHRNFATSWVFLLSSAHTQSLLGVWKVLVAAFRLLTDRRHYVERRLCRGAWSDDSYLNCIRVLATSQEMKLRFSKLKEKNRPVLPVAANSECLRPSSSTSSH